METKENTAGTEGELQTTTFEGSIQPVTTIQSEIQSELDSQPELDIENPTLKVYSKKKRHVPTSQAPIIIPESGNENNTSDPIQFLTLCLLLLMILKFLLL